MLTEAAKLVFRNLGEPLRLVGALASDPLEAWTAFYDHLLTDQDIRRGRAFEGGPADLYSLNRDWEAQLHGLLGCAWPCSTTWKFWLLCREIVRELEAYGVAVGPESYKGNNDGDQGLVRAIWCLVRHLRPRTVVETGVAHGMSSRVILEALERNGGHGRLWSIDRPPREQELRARIGIAVGDRFPDRWSLMRGTSRRHLPGLLSRLGQVDLFIHDSLHSEHNVRFELDRVWPVLRPGGAIVVDDIDANWGFRSFTQSISGHTALVCEAEPIRPDMRRFNKKGLFGIILKDAA
jgi:hypothetical protein